MASSVEERRRRDRRVLGLGVAVAAGLHIVAIALLPGLPAPEPLSPELEVDRPEAVAGKTIPLEVFFGPPIIDGVGGERFFEPPTRVLSDQRAVFLPASCRVSVERANQVFSGTVRLQVNESGRIDSAEVQQSTGTACADQVLVRVSGDLWYHWLPTDEFTAPVRLTQPMTFTEIGDV